MDFISISALFLSVVAVILLIVLMIKYRDKGSKPLISKEEEEWLKEEWR